MANPLRPPWFRYPLVHSTKPLSSTPSTDEIAHSNENSLRLKKGGSDKFARRTGGMIEVSKRTLSADQVIGEIMDDGRKLFFYPRNHWSIWGNW